MQPVGEVMDLRITNPETAAETADAACLRYSIWRVTVTVRFTVGRQEMMCDAQSL